MEKYRVGIIGGTEWLASVLSRSWKKSVFDLVVLRQSRVRRKHMRKPFQAVGLNRPLFPKRQKVLFF
jgi:hypothetical protein